MSINKPLTLRTIFLSICLVFSLSTYAQLDSEHYLPPLKQYSSSSSIVQQAVYFSTPVTTAFPIEIYIGISTTPLLTITGLAKGAGKIFDNLNGLADKNNNITLVDNGNTGKVLSNSGLRIVAPGGQKFYVNYRGRSSAQAGSLTSKGSKAKGLEFRWGGIPNKATTTALSSSLGMMATVDGTVVTVTNNKGCHFRVNTNLSGITAAVQTINLNKGQTFVLEAVTNQVTANIDGFIGTKITATQPIVVSNGGLNVGIRVGSQARDVGIDQAVGIATLGREYVFVRGLGQNEAEFPVIVATQNNTEVFASGVSLGFINDGDYIAVPGSNYSSANAGASMFVETSKEVYAYQCLQGAGGTKIQTIGMNFIAPVNCLLPDVMDEISDIGIIAGTPSLASAITIIASALTPDNQIIIKQDGVQVATPTSVIPAGTTDWKSFYVPGLTGAIDVSSPGPIAVGTFMSLGTNAGLAGYFSGFDTIPFVGIVVSGGGCVPSGQIQTADNFDAYQWFYEGVAIAGATANTYQPTELGSYHVDVTDATCTYSSAIIPVYSCLPDIVVKKTSDVSVPVTDDEIVNFTVKVESLGVDPVTNLVITDVFPTQLDIVSVTPSFGTWSSPNWTIGTMEAGDLYLLNIQTKVPKKPSEGTFTNTVSNSQTETDSDTTADDLTENFTITAKKADLTLLKTVNKSVVKIGDEVQFTLTLTNNGPQSATGVQVKDILPSGLTYNAINSTIPANTSYTAGTGIWDLSTLTLTNGQTIVLTIAASVTSNNLKLNTTEVLTTNQLDSDSTPNSSN